MRALDPLLQSSCNRMLLIGFLILGVHLGTLYQCFKQNLAVAIAFYFSSDCLQFFWSWRHWVPFHWAMDCARAGLMGDHLALLVDRLLTESTLEAAIGGAKRMVDLHPEAVTVEYCHRGVGGGGGGSASKMVECRICQEEDWDSSMEAPCACCGSLKVILLSLSWTKIIGLDYAADLWATDNCFSEFVKNVFSVPVCKWKVGYLFQQKMGKWLVVPGL